MVERFGDAALRHLATAELLEEEGRIDDAAYHYGLVGEMALKAALIKVLGSLPRAFHLHINDTRKPLQVAIMADTQIIMALNAGRLGGALGADLTHSVLPNRFAKWSLDIRYADDRHCPVNPTDVVMWKADAIALYNGGAF